MVVLLWLASCDGPINSPELALVLRAASRSAAAIRAAADAAEEAGELTFEALRIALERLMRCPAQQRHGFLKLAVRVALCDGPLSPAEHQAIRLIADVCGAGADGETLLAKAMAESGRPLAPPSDPTSLAFWESEEQRAPRARAPETPISVLGLREIRDLATLGLGPGANADEVRAAHRRFAKANHPDLARSTEEIAQRNDAMSAATAAMERLLAR